MTTSAKLRPLLAVLLLIALSGCAAQRPVVYPHGEAESVGEAAVDADIDTCIELAKASGVDDGRSERVAKETATNTAIGAGSGAVVGAIAGNPGRGALYGAAGTAVATLLRGVLSAPESDSLHRRFVADCLRERGYTMLGWK